MTRQHKTASVKMAFEAEGQRIAIADIQPLKLVSEAVKKTPNPDHARREAFLHVC